MAKKVVKKSAVAGVKSSYAGTKSGSVPTTPAPSFKKGGSKMKKKC